MTRRLFPYVLLCGSFGACSGKSKAPSDGPVSEAVDAAADDTFDGDAAQEAADAAQEAADVAMEAADAAQDATPACDPSAPFGAPLPLEGVNTVAGEGGPRLTADELTLYFSRAVSGSVSRLFVAHRRRTTDPFDPPTPLTALDSAFDEFDPTTSTTELTIFFTSVDRPVAGGGDIWVATRARNEDPFGAPSALPAPLNSGASDVQPFLRADEAELWFASNRPGGAGGAGNYDIYRAPKVGAAFGSPELVAELSAPSSTEFAPTVRADGLVVLFASSRAGVGAQGDEDIWIASRAKVTDPLSHVADVFALNSVSADFPGWLSADGCRLYMSSTRSGNEDIYLATRGP